LISRLTLQPETIPSCYRRSRHTEFQPHPGRHLVPSTITLITELEDALNSGSPEKRVDTLRRVTGLFLNEADRLNEQQISVFDDVLVHLVQRIESKALVQLSTSLAPVDNAPIETIRNLARNDEIAIAGPVLTQSTRLVERDLVEIAKSKGQGHLLAISGRSSLTEAVTDVLVERGNREVAHRLAVNSGARFSETGFAVIVKSAGSDEALVQKLGLRLDIPLQMLRELLSRATGLVRARLLAAASPEKRDQIQRVIDSIAHAVGWEAAGPRDFRNSESLVQQLNRNGQLNESVLVEFIKERRYEEMTSTLALFCMAPVEFIETLMKGISAKGLIVACKAAKLNWPTVKSILQIRFSHHSISNQELDEARNAFLALSQATAQRTLRFMLVQTTAKKA
jgi:uncharacterized protein (DUF2336 family)